MKQTKWLVSLLACQVLMVVSVVDAKEKLPVSALNVELCGDLFYQDKDSSSLIPRQGRELAGLDTIPLPSCAYSIGREVDSILVSSSLQPFFVGLDCQQSICCNLFSFT